MSYVSFFWAYWLIHVIGQSVGNQSQQRAFSQCLNAIKSAPDSDLVDLIYLRKDNMDPKVYVVSWLPHQLCIFIVW